MKQLDDILSKIKASRGKPKLLVKSWSYLTKIEGTWRSLALISKSVNLLKNPDTTWRRIFLSQPISQPFQKSTPYPFSNSIIAQNRNCYYYFRRKVNNIISHFERITITKNTRLSKQIVNLYPWHNGKVVSWVQMAYQIINLILIVNWQIIDEQKWR